jgi:Protein of unknown function (DUF1329)
MRPILITLVFLMFCQLPAPAAEIRAFSEKDLIKLLAGGVYSARIASLVHNRGISFVPTAQDLALLRRAGADKNLLREVVTAPRLLPSQQPLQSRAQLHVSSQSVTKTTTPGSNSALDLPPIASASKANITNLTQTPSSSGPEAFSTLAPPAGSRITMENWREYAQYMPLGMRELFEGHYFWRMPADIEIVLGPTIPERLPEGYTEATSRYSGKVEVIHLPDRRNDIKNYLGGEPFPHPTDPDKGYKLLADLWFAYVPHLLVGTAKNPLTICSQTAHGYVSCGRLSYVFRQTAYNTDGKVSAEETKGNNYWYTEWTSIEEPEELRYTTLLRLYPKDNQREQELFVFAPSLRRWFRGSLPACSPVVGTDYAEDDFKRVGFNGGLGSFDAKFLEHQRVLALTGDYAPLGGDFPANYYRSLGWPRSSWGNWQLRDVDVIDVRRISGDRASYCYGKRIIYEDSETRYALWEDAYDKNMHLWKLAFLAQRLVNEPSLGAVPGAFSSTAWDLKNRHLTNTSTQSRNGQDVFVDGEVPTQYRDFVAYSTPAGLAEIMK